MNGNTNHVVEPAEGRSTRNGYIAVFQPGIDDQPNTEKRKGWIGSRHVVTFMLFLGMANAYVMRTNMSVAIVAMVNHTAIGGGHDNEPLDDECDGVYANENSNSSRTSDGEFIWETDLQGYILSSFFYGYVITQIPFGILSKKYGALYFLGVGMLINSVFGLLVPISSQWGVWWLIVIRFIQGLGEGPIVPCTHAMLAKWIPPNERSRMGAFVYAGAQFGTVISMPLSGLLSASTAGWPSIFYVFGAIGTVWSIAFLIFVHEDPASHPRIDPEEKKYIEKVIWGSSNTYTPPVPWKSIVTSLPFWAILIAHMGHNYGYETLMTELPTYMKQVLHFNIKDNGFLSALPYLAMWFFSMGISHVADWMLTKKYFTHTSVRKIINGIGQYGPAVALFAAAFTGCDRWLTVALLTVGVGLNGGIYSGFKVNHLDISPRFAGILMSFTNCLANLAGLLAPIYAGNIIKGQPTQAKWRIVFITAAAVYAGCCTFYSIFASGQRQPWDDPATDDPKKSKRDPESAVTSA
ncbi:putative inorganic phosphate cotransporter [Agrilus planipennis]|uniref:Putative inorganic phosphate cotransporter n=1 Tax=Agrilus planipennis TaxID=224129 RepID=A0A1W4WKJ9_AGRPL|nr:putative inorganic phosphate cotransporter [Agrilus planipennis]